MLHILTTGTGIETLLQRIAKNDALLFTNESVLSLYKGSQSAASLAHYRQQRQYYVLEADLLARGLAINEMMAEVTPVDYAGFVSLTVEQEVIKSWY